VTNLQKYKGELVSLIEKSKLLYYALIYELSESKPENRNKVKKLLEKDKLELISFSKEYEKWYTEALEVIKQILPSRYDDFRYLYRNEKRKVVNSLTYSIYDYMIGLNTQLAKPEYAFKKFEQQMKILEAAERQFQSSLFRIKQLLQADLFDSEIDTARELLRNGYVRASGAVAGVVLEKHLQQVCDSHSIVIKAKTPCISDYNDALKEAGVIEIPNWRSIQHLSDLRNLCDHKKQREPKTEEIEDLLNGVDKISKTVY